MSSLCCRPRSPAVKTPLEDDDLLSEILPPQPSSLPRASLVCKRWRILTSDRGFFRRFRIHHRRKPPILGIFDGFSGSFLPTLQAPNRVHPGRFSVQGGGDGRRFRSFGCRHGLVLFLDLKLHFLVWDPVTGDQRRVAIPSGLATLAEKTVINGEVLRTGGEAHFQFQVVLATTVNDDKQHRRALACVYSSDTGLWGDIFSTLLPSEFPSSGYPNALIFLAPGKPSVLAGNSIYWMLSRNFDGDEILEFDLEKQTLAVIQLPVHVTESRQFWIVRAEGGGLGLLFLEGSILQLWKRNTDCDGVASWALGRTIELDKLLSLDSEDTTVLGFAEENNVVVLWACGVVFMVHLESLQFKKLFETCTPAHYHPFESFYPAGIGGGHDAADLLHHT